MAEVNEQVGKIHMAQRANRRHDDASDRHPRRYFRSDSLRTSRSRKCSRTGAQSHRDRSHPRQHSAASAAAGGVQLPPVRDGRPGDRRTRAMARVGPRARHRFAVVHDEHASALSRRRLPLTFSQISGLLRAAASWRSCDAIPPWLRSIHLHRRRPPTRPGTEGISGLRTAWLTRARLA